MIVGCLRDAWLLMITTYIYKQLMTRNKYYAHPPLPSPLIVYKNKLKRHFSWATKSYI